MPTYPAYGVNPPTTAFPEATTTNEPVASSSAPRWYVADYHHPLPATGRKVYSDFNTVFVPLLLLAAGVGVPAACFGR